MSVRIVFLGPLTDMASESPCELAAPLDWNGLLMAMGPQIAALLQDQRVRLACAGEVLADKTALFALDGDEVALLPPVSGG